MILTQTPLRLSLCGGGSDYASWYRQHGGLVVGGTINHYSYLSARFLPPYHAFRTRVVYSDTERVETNDLVQHRAVRACLQYFGWDTSDAPGLEITHMADLPGRSGTGSSSSFVVGLLNALSWLKGRPMLPECLAEAAISVEQELMKETVGCQDQHWAARGGVGSLHFYKNGDVHFHPLFLSGDKLARLEQHLLLFFTGIHRHSSEVAASYAGSLGQRDREQWAMVRLAERAIRAIEREDYPLLGDVIDQSWRLKSSLSELVSNQHINRIYSTARVCGAWGGKITGAGGGGCMVLVAPPDRQESIVRQLKSMGCVHIPFRFTEEGSRVVFAQRGSVG